MTTRILLVEDDASIRELTAIGLRAAGYGGLAGLGRDRFVDRRCISGRFPTGAEIPASKGRRFKQYLDDPAAHEVLARLTAFADARGHTILELAIAWLLAHPAIPTVIAGAMSPEQIRPNAAAADWQLSLEERDEIDAIASWDGTGDEVEEPGMHTMERPRR